MSEYIDMTPTWAWAAEVYMDTLANPSASDDALEAAREDLRVMAKLADKWNEHQKEGM